MAFVQKDKASKSISFRVPPQLAALHTEAMQMCERAGGRLELGAALQSALEQELKATIRQLKSLTANAG
ncbi:hypothetical protein IP87_18015 [beta proteobacterium AAP121]|jgi:hypothetical protein|nr:hypothetical protein IP80_20525 [beta proteobacterium AAP65]KPF94865.1 hypothetical protein IP87_18015 [beta proteobacterium AAP121]